MRLPSSGIVAKSDCGVENLSRPAYIPNALRWEGMMCSCAWTRHRQKHSAKCETDGLEDEMKNQEKGAYVYEVTWGKTCRPEARAHATHWCGRTRKRIDADRF